MNQKQHIEIIIKDLQVIIEELIEDYNIPVYMPIEKCLSTCDIEELVLKSEGSIYDQLDGTYKKELKSFFSDLKKINFLGNPHAYYYKNNTIRLSSNILDTLWFDGSKDSIGFIIETYIKYLKEFLDDLSFIKYVQYVLDISGLKLEIGKEKLTIEESGIIITFPFEEKDVDKVLELIGDTLKNKKMEAMSSVLLLRKTNNDIYVPERYEDYYLPEVFKPCLENFYINSINQAKYVKVFYENEFINVAYLSAYEFMNNKINKPFCYFYIKGDQLLDDEIETKINKILKLQDALN